MTTSSSTGKTGADLTDVEYKAPHFINDDEPLTHNQLMDAGILTQ